MINLLIALAVLTLITAFCWAVQQTNIYITNNKNEKNTINNLKAHYKHNTDTIKTGMVNDLPEIQKADYRGLKAGETVRNSFCPHRSVRFTVNNIKRSRGKSGDDL